MISLETLRLYSVCSLFLSCNFVVFAIPPLIFGALNGILWCRLVLLLGMAECFVFPIHQGIRGYWQAWSDLCDITEGLKYENRAEIIVEGSEMYRKDKNYCLIYLPHSLYGIGLFTIRRYFLDAHNIVMLFTGAEVIFYIPVLRRIMTWWGYTSVSAERLKKNLHLPHPYNMLMLQPDGIAGMFYGMDHEQVVLQRRRGFCRIALETGASLVPCYALGANGLYGRKFGPTSLAAKISRKYHVSCLYWSGRWGVPFGFLPKPEKLVFAIGPPIDVEQTKEPTTRQIDDLHNRFVQEIKGLYDRHKHRMGKEWAETHDRLYLESEEAPKKSM